MQYLWNPTIEQILEAQKLARSHGKVAGQDYTEEFLEIMKRDNVKHSGATELLKSELLEEYASHGKKVAHLQTDDKGKQTLKIHKKEE